MSIGLELIKFMVKNKALIWDMVKEMSKECLVISVSHDTQTVEKYADRIIL